jgi:hypothetical protein
MAPHGSPLILHAPLLHNVFPVMMSRQQDSVVGQHVNVPFGELQHLKPVAQQYGKPVVVLQHTGVVLEQQTVRFVLVHVVVPLGHSHWQVLALKV